jgi:hypothetical protein
MGLPLQFRTTPGGSSARSAAATTLISCSPARGSERLHIHEMMLPRIQPIIPIRRKEPFDDPDWLFELKYDGFRGLWRFDRGRARLISRNGNFMSRFDALAVRVAAALNVDEAILDGEVIVSDETVDRSSMIFSEARGHPPMRRSISSGSTVMTCGLCSSASAAAACRAFFRRDRRSSPRRCVGRRQGTRVIRTYVYARPRRNRGEALARSVCAAHQMAQNQEPGLYAAGGQRRAAQWFAWPVAADGRS